MKCREVNHMVKRTTWEGCNMGKKSRCGTEVSGKPKMAKQAHTFIRPRTMLLWVITIADFIGVWPLAYINWIKNRYRWPSGDYDIWSICRVNNILLEDRGERIVFFSREMKRHPWTFRFWKCSRAKFRFTSAFLRNVHGQKKKSRVKFLKMFTGAFHG